MNKLDKHVLNVLDLVTDVIKEKIKEKEEQGLIISREVVEDIIKEIREKYEGILK